LNKIFIILLLTGCSTFFPVDPIDEYFDECFFVSRIEICREETTFDFGECRVWFTNSKFGIVRLHERGAKIFSGDQACRRRNSNYFRLVPTRTRLI
jgi:hypothetical protein